MLNIIMSYLRNKNVYKFSPKDMFMHFYSSGVKLPKVYEVTKKNNYFLLKIGDEQLYWPSKFSYIDLPWLYSEIFDNFNLNPHSYNFPSIDFENINWAIDGGACEGFFSIFAQNANINKIIAIEPISELKDSLVETFNNFYPDREFKVILGALGEKEEKLNISFSANNIAESKFTDNTNNTREVDVYTLDKIFNMEDIKDGSGIIKMDIEGAEMDALKGAVNVMKKYKPILLVAVYHSYMNAIECRDIIKQANPEYKIEFRGIHSYYKNEPGRPMMLYAY